MHRDLDLIFFFFFLRNISFNDQRRKEREKKENPVNIYIGFVSYAARVYCSAPRFSLFFCNYNTYPCYSYARKVARSFISNAVMTRPVMHQGERNFFFIYLIIFSQVIHVTKRSFSSQLFDLCVCVCV